MRKLLKAFIGILAAVATVATAVAAAMFWLSLIEGDFVAAPIWGFVAIAGIFAIYSYVDLLREKQ